MKNRSISTDALAIRYGLECSSPEVRRACRAFLGATMARHGGKIAGIVDALGMSRSAYEALRRDHEWIRGLEAKLRKIDRVA
jgi:hypothetical protein